MGARRKNEDVFPSELAEINLVATPTKLRKIAAFLEAAAGEMERMGEAYSHELHTLWSRPSGSPIAANHSLQTPSKLLRSFAKS